MVRENGVSQAIDSENRSEKLEALTYPLAPMFVVVAGILIQAAEKRLPDAALDCMNDLNLPGLRYSPRACLAITSPPDQTETGISL